MFIQLKETCIVACDSCGKREDELKNNEILKTTHYKKYGKIFCEPCLKIFNNGT